LLPSKVRVPLVYIFADLRRHIPKPLEDADSEVSPDAGTRRNMMRMVIPFSNVTTQC